MAKKQIEKSTEIKNIEKLLNEQTSTILNAVDERLVKTEVRLNARMDKKLLEMEERINQRFVNMEARFDDKLMRMEERMGRKFEKLTATIDKFIKRLSDTEDEIEVMKLDINRIKAVIKEKVGVDLA